MEIETFCTKCRDERIMSDMTIQVSDSGRRMARGKCSVCDTKVYRILGNEKVMEENFFQTGDAYEVAKSLMRKVHGFFQPDIEVIYSAIKEAYDQGVRDGKQES
jgi:hypothetical protein